jgi:hypothetical protein
MPDHDGYRNSSLYNPAQMEQREYKPGLIRNRFDAVIGLVLTEYVAALTARATCSQSAHHSAQAIYEIGGGQLLTFRASAVGSRLRPPVLQRREIQKVLRPKSLPSLLPAVRCGRLPHLGVRFGT